MGGGYHPLDTSESIFSLMSHNGLWEGSMQVVRHVFNALSTIVLIVLVALVVAFAGVRLVGLTPYAVLSGSMEPELPVGSLIYVQDVDPQTIQVGDTVTFLNGSDQVVTHQAYEVDLEAREIGTQGINNHTSDGGLLHDAEPVPFERVLGVPVACVPYLGYLNAWITSVPGIFIVIALAIVAIALPWLADLLGGDKKPQSDGGARPAGKHMR